MKTRCFNPKHKQWPGYGGRGISVCQRWIDSYEAFLEDMGRRPSPKHSLDRKNNEGNYKPENCRWATSIQQNRNTRKSRHITIDGKTQTLAAWLEESPISRGTFQARLRKGWAEEEALTKPACDRTGKPFK